jgi:cytochrome c biogenesis protein CcmG/thiol:disulfide interchange protein DsbE
MEYVKIIIQQIAPKLNSIINILLIVLISFLLYKRLPGLLEQFNQENTLIPSGTIELLNGSSIELSQSPLPLIAVFWATWCPPCEVELTRINRLIKKGEIAASHIIAISSYEERTHVEDVAKKRDYRFQIGFDDRGDLATRLKVTGTPTIVFINQQHKIEWMTTGLSPLLEIRIKKFLKSTPFKKTEPH